MNSIEWMVRQPQIREAGPPRPVKGRKYHLPKATYQAMERLILAGRYSQSQIAQKLKVKAADVERALIRHQMGRPIVPCDEQLFPCGRSAKPRVNMNVLKERERAKQRKKLKTLVKRYSVAEAARRIGITSSKAYRLLTEA